MVQCHVELVNRSGAEGVAYEWAVDRDADCAMGDCPVVGDVRQCEALHGAPRRRVEQLGNKRFVLGHAKRLWPCGRPHRLPVPVMESSDVGLVTL